MEKTKKILAYLSISSLLLPWVVKAQISGGTIPQVNLPLLGGGTFRGTVVYVINILIAIAGIIAVLFLIYGGLQDRKSTRLNSSHQIISYAVFCLKKKTKNRIHDTI